jgi:uncharacterized MAPEG superfamily protein
MRATQVSQYGSALSRAYDNPPARGKATRITLQLPYCAKHESIAREEEFMPPFDFGTVEGRYLWASAFLGLVQLLLAILFSLNARGLLWAAGARDQAGASMGTIGGRIERAYRNFLETFPLFAAMVLLASGLGIHNGLTVWGAQLYFFGRVLYVPLYAFGIAYVRTLAWGIAMGGIVSMFIGIYPGN